MQRYDYVIAGGGLSGMLLAFYLAQSHLRHKKILILEKHLSKRYQRDWSYWIDQPHPFETIVAHRWNKIESNFNGGKYQLPLKTYRYELIRSEDLFNFIAHNLQKHPNIEIIEAAVEKAVDAHQFVRTVTNRGEFVSTWLFNSVPPNLKHEQTVNSMKGCSWMLRTDSSVFDASTMVFCDYRHTIPDLPGFFYLLPLSQNEVVLYYAAFSPSTHVTEQHLTDHAHKYLIGQLQLKEYQLISRGCSQYPLPSSKIKRSPSSRIVPIGAAAGLIKSSTSFGFTNILRDTQMLATALELTGRPFFSTPSRIFYKLGDLSMNYLINNKPEKIPILFQAMFAAISTGDELFNFLDEKGSICDHTKIINGVNPKLFFQY